MFNSLRKNKYFWLFASITVIGLYLRFLFSNYLGSFLFDEYYSVYFTRFSLAKMLSLLIYDANMPLYRVILWFWVRIFGDSEIIVRSFQIICSATSAILLYCLGKKMFSQKTAVIASIFLAFSSYIIFYTTEATTYSLLVVLSLLSTWFFWKLFNGSTSWWQKCGYLAASILLAYTHFSGSFLLVGQVIFIMIIYWKEKRKIINWLPNFLIIGLFTLPYYLYFYLVKKETLFSSYFLQHPYSWGYLLLVYRQFFNVYGDNSIWGLIYILLPYLILGSFIIIKAAKAEFDFGIKIKFSPAVSYCLVAIFSTVVLCFGFKIIDGRYAMVAAVFLFLLIGEGMVNWLGRSKIWGVIIIALILFSLTSPYKFLFTEMNTFGRVGQCLEEIAQANSKIIVNNFAYDVLVKKYYKGNLPVEGFYPLDDNLTYEERIIRGSGLPLITKENINKLAGYLKGYDKISLVEAIYVPLLDLNDDVKKWLINNGWKVEDRYCYIEGRVKVYNFYRDK